MLATPYQESDLWLAVLEHFGTPYNVRAMGLLSLETSSLLVYPVNARSGASAEHLRFLLGTRLECLCSQPWLPFEEDRTVGSLCCGLSDY